MTADRGIVLRYTVSFADFMQLDAAGDIASLVAVMPAPTKAGRASIDGDP